MSDKQPGKITLFPFQQRVSALVLGGHNVVLQAPTGSGKTRAALWPFIVNLTRADREMVLPRTCRYAVPLRALATQFYKEHADLGTRIDGARASLSRLDETYKAQGLEFVREQTGEQAGDRQFEAGLTFCTIDQLLAAFLGIPYGVSPRMTNLKVAGVFGSYIVLDEWHLYPLRAIDAAPGQWDIQGARATSLAMLDLLRQQELARFVLMTATFSTTLVAGLAELLGATLENLRQGGRDGESEDDAFARELRNLSGDQARTFCRGAMPVEDSVEEILAEHVGSTLVVCNQVERAQRVYLRLRAARDRQGSGAPEVLLLHSRFSVEDRRNKAARLEALLGREAWEARADGSKPNIIVVATQVVEVGLNISVSILHTDLAPANSLVQRAGRCARFPGQRGRVIVHPLPDTPRSVLPYAEGLCAATFSALPAGPEEYGFSQEQSLIDAVHTGEDTQFLERFKVGKAGIVERIFTAWGPAQEIGAAAALIRDVEQVPVLIHDQPNEIINEEPWRWQAFGLRRGTLMGRWNRLQELRQEYRCDWAIKQVRIAGESRHNQAAQEADSRSPLACTWEVLTTSEQLRGALMLVLPSALAHYSDEIGFAFRDPERLPGLPEPEGADGGWHSRLLPPHISGRYGPYRIERQSYEEHISGLIGAYQAGLADEMRWAATQLERVVGFPPGAIDRAVRLAIAMHDLGKLAERWQRWARAWQDVLVRAHGSSHGAPAGQYLAKTEFDGSRGSDHRTLQTELKIKRPNHAVESVALGDGLLRAAIKQLAPELGHQRMLTKALRTAIARHHTTDAFQHGQTQLAPGAIPVLLEATSLAVGTAWWSFDPVSLIKTSPLTEGSLVTKLSEMRREVTIRQRFGCTS